MSENATAMADPFEATALDEKTELAALANSLRLTDGFRLLFARCNQPNQRVRLMTTLMSDFPPDAVVAVHFPEPIPHLLDALREHLPASPPRAIFVSGLEYSLPIAAEAEATSFIANLNASRNSFPYAISCPLVLWLPEYALTAFVRGAPDFFSIRSGVYFFASSPEETAPLVSAVTTGDYWQVANFPLLEKQERVAAIESLLQDYRALPPNRRDYRAEAQLLERLGHLYNALGQWAKAEQTYQQSLQICRDVQYHQVEAQVLNDLGNVYEDQGRWPEAEQAYQQSLQICRDLNEYKPAGMLLNNLGVVYHKQGRWIEGEQALRQSLQISRDLGDHHAEGMALVNLGNVYDEQGQVAEAEQAYKQSLKIRCDMRDRQGEGEALNNLGIIYQRQGRWAEADQVFQQSLLICRELGNLTGEGATFGNIASLKEAQGNITEAIKFGQFAIKVLMTTEDVALLRKIQDWVQKWEGLR